jgi:hypothetical protein
MWLERVRQTIRLRARQDHTWSCDSKSLQKYTIFVFVRTSMRAVRLDVVHQFFGSGRDLR